MYTQENYYWGLVAYGLGVLLLLPMTWWLSRVLLPWRIARDLFRLVALALMLTPVRAYEDVNYLAPAWVVAAFEFLRPTTDMGPARALAPLAMALIAVCGLYLLWVLARRLLSGERGGAG